MEVLIKRKRGVLKDITTHIFIFLIVNLLEYYCSLNNEKRFSKGPKLKKILFNVIMRVDD